MKLKWQLFFTFLQTDKSDFKTLNKIKIFLIPSWGGHVRIWVQTPNRKLASKTKKKKKASSSQLVSNIIIPLLCLSELQKLPFFCLFGVCSSEDSCKQTQSKHPSQHQRARTQKPVAPPGGNTDFYSPTAEIPLHGVNSFLNWSETRTVCTTELVCLSCFNCWWLRREEN